VQVVAEVQDAQFTIQDWHFEFASLYLEFEQVKQIFGFTLLQTEQPVKQLVQVV
jgi:hypothetical protein